jgi:tetratricopeptide (TPR) repeat protein
MLLALFLTAAAAQPHFLEPGEILERFESSPHSYSLETEPEPSATWEEHNLAVMYPERKGLDCVAKGADGRPVACKVSKDSEEKLRAVETAFQNKEYKLAEAAYADLVTRHPDEYLPLLSWGDAAYFDHRAGDALPRYERARKLNPADHLGWYYSGNALFALGRKEEALAAWTHALVLRPHHEPLLRGVELRAREIGYKLDRRHFSPRALVTAKGDGAVIRTAAHQTTEQLAPWLAWGGCKALWLGEDKHRIEVLGDAKIRFSMQEEFECMVDLIVSDRKHEVTAVERIREIGEAHMLFELIYFDLATRLEPHLALQQSEQTTEALEKYVRRYVLVPAQ